jgi:DJ-1/PfpI family
MTSATVGQSGGPVLASGWHRVHGCPERRGQAASRLLSRSPSTGSITVPVSHLPRSHHAADDRVNTLVKQIGILLFTDVEELDAVGPWEVLSSWTRKFPRDGYGVSCISACGGLVRCAKGLVRQAHHSYADMPPLEVLIYPGGQGTRAHLQDESQLDWVRHRRDEVPLMTSVCTGSRWTGMPRAEGCAVRWRPLLGRPPPRATGLTVQS